MNSPRPLKLFIHFAMELISTVAALKDGPSKMVSDVAFSGLSRFKELKQGRIRGYRSRMRVGGGSDTVSTSVSLVTFM